jgi:hypothetical protein
VARHGLGVALDQHKRGSEQRFRPRCRIASWDVRRGLASGQQQGAREGAGKHDPEHGQPFFERTTSVPVGPAISPNDQLEEGGART